MTPERWAQLQTLFHRVAECEPEACSQLLHEVGLTDPELRRELDALLRSSKSANFRLRAVVREEAGAIGFLDTGSRGPGVSFPSEATTSRGGNLIGPYRLLRLIGEGGMGEVWLANQEYPVRRLVALKLIKAGMDTREVVARFETERQTVALMDHPAIAKVFDAGSTPEGRPYFVMEHVAGIPITEYCDKQNLTINQRLHLFVLVCEGVQHAHQRAIIHRDLKPSNILVADLDGKPLPMIIDFGVAKAISHNPAATTMVTQAGAVIGTFGYMSPEQAGSACDDIDTRADVYSLGALLYELLSGSLPFNFRNIPLDECLRRLREQDAPAPSTRLRNPGLSHAIIARNRSTGFERLVRQIRGDLDAIALKAIEKDKTQRYAGAAELAADLRRYLNDEPIIARTASTPYQLHKFARRHKTLITGVTALFSILTAGIVASGWEAGRARRAEELAIKERKEAATSQQAASRERDRALKAEGLANYERDRAVEAEAKAIGERNLAIDEKRRADTISAFLQHDLLAQAGVDTQARPDVSPDPDLKVRTALDRAAATVGIRFSRRPLMEAEVRKTIGVAYKELGLYTEADNELKGALELQMKMLGEQHIQTLSTMWELAHNLFRNEGRYEQARPLLLKIVDARRRRLGEDNPATLEAMNKLGDLYRFQGQLKMAEPLLAKVLDRSRRVMGELSPLTLDIKNNLGLVYKAQKRYADAEILLSSALNGTRSILGVNDPETLIVNENLASVYAAEGRYPQADFLYTSVLFTRQRVLGTDHPETLRTMEQLAATYVEERKYEEAGTLYRQTLELQTRVLGEDKLPTLRTAHSLARWYFDQGRYTESEQLCMDALKTSFRVLGAQHPLTARNAGLLGELRLEQQRYAEAESLLREALKVFMTLNIDRLTRYAWQSALGASLAAQNRDGEAESLLISAYESMRRLKSPPDASRFWFERALRRLVDFYRDREQPEKAAEWQKELDGLPEKMPR